MGKTLDGIISTVAGLALLGSVFYTPVSCVPPNPPRAKRDYGLYPKARKEIAFYNTKKILDVVCGGGAEVTPEGFSCSIENPCSFWQKGYGEDMVCAKKSNTYFAVKWKEIRSVGIEEGMFFQINGERKFRHFYPETLRDLEEAIKIYTGLKRVE